MKNSVKMILVLVAVSLLSGASLVLVHDYAQPRIEKNQKTGLEEAIFEVLPGAKSYETIVKDGGEIYAGKDSMGRIIGYALVAGGSGYQGEIVLIAGCGPTLKEILAIEILESSETPGLGGRIREDDFKSQFRNLPVAFLGTDDVHAITGATVSSNAVVSILNDKIEEARRLIR